MSLTRRRFLTSASAVSAGFLALRRLAETASAQAVSRPGGAGRRAGAGYKNEVDIYGPLVADPKRIFDLPVGFQYTIVSSTGDTMSDGLRVPGAPDGMAAFKGPAGRIILVRNHELDATNTFDGPFGVDGVLLGKVPREKLYDAGEGVRPHQGGTTTVVYDPVRQRVERQFLSLAGTSRNCAGGPTPWNTWITCEETVEVSAAADKRRRERLRRRRDGDESESAEPEVAEVRTNFNEKDHGYNFEVPADPNSGMITPVPLVAMGRFFHEAVAVDPASGVVYQTEDRDDGLFYRFIPEQPGKLMAGGRLQALAIRGVQAMDTRNWAETGEPKVVLHASMDAEWIDLDRVDSPNDDLRIRGYRKGAARFARGEGMWFGRNELFFACTSGGISKSGQIFRYRPSLHEGTRRESESPGKLSLYLEVNNTHLMQSCDNVTVAPWGELFICEDGPDYNYLRGVTGDGRIYTFGSSAYHTLSELCGACFAADPPTLFINLQRPGLTLAITGPWKPSVRA